MSSSNSVNNVMYIYNLPHQERRELCRILDQNDRWEELGGTYMKFDVMTLQDIRREIMRGHSPTEELLTMWGHQNHTVLELFILLSQMHHYQSMVTLKPFVDTKYHKLIHEGEHNLSNLIQRLQVRNKNEPCTKDLGIAQENFEKVLNKGIPEPVLSNNIVSTENNESIESNNINAVRNTNTRGVSDSAGPTSIPQIPYEQLQAATNNWNQNTILGRGGFGTVFKGTWKCTLVAIKRIEQRSEAGAEDNSIQIKQSITELHCLNAYRHDNVLPLYGYGIGGPHPCLVYQFMPGGALEARLRVPKQYVPLPWLKRFNIAKGVARGLQFLHTIGDKPLIHGDIKSANILLDQNDEAKIGDFGLAREGPQSDYTHMKVSRIHGTRPYLPDEFLRAKQISTKVDTYSYGVVLFEIATGLSAYSENRSNKFLKDHVCCFEGDVLDLKDTKGGSENERYFYYLIDIGKACVSKKARDRPEMRNVLMQLESIHIQ